MNNLSLTSIKKQRSKTLTPNDIQVHSVSPSSKLISKIWPERLKESRTINFTSALIKNPASIFKQHKKNQPSLPNSKAFSSFTGYIYSQIPSGLDTFKLLESIHSKDPYFTIPICKSVVINCGFDKIMLVDSEPQLKFKSANEIDQVNKFFASFYPSQIERSKTPLFIFKYRSSKRLEFSINELLTNLREFKSDSVIQKFILPRGLRVIKYRVVLNEHTKVLIISNKVRIDSKEDLKVSKILEKPKADKKVLETVVLHHDISTAMASNLNWNTITRIRSEGLKKMEYFKVLENTKEKEALNSNSVFSESERFLLNRCPDKNELFVGKNQSFSEIIKITEYLWSKIDFYYLDNSRLTELACDFMQDKCGNWYFIKVKYGKIEAKEKIQRKKVIRKILKPKMIYKICGSLLNQYS